MKRVLFILLAVVIVASALGVQVGNASAEGYIAYEEASFVYGKGIVYIFSASGFRNRDLKDAAIYVGSHFYDLFCWVTEDEEHIVCNAQGGLTQFAGQTGIIYLGGQIFYVPIPSRGSPSAADTVPTCGPGEVLGANYMVDFGSGYDGPYFVPGDTLAEADALADSWFSEEDHYRIGGLVCDVEPS
jgi:hypothetical protein